MQLRPTGDVAQNDVLIYVNSSTGNDLNNGSSGAPLLTIEKAVSRLPRFWIKKCRILLTGSFTLANAVSQFDFGRPVGPLAEPLVFVGSYTTTATGTFTAVSIGTKTLTDGSKAFTVNALRGQHVRVTSGPAAGQRYSIVSNTATTITVDKIAGTEVNGNGYVVEAEAVTINHQTVNNTALAGTTTFGFNVGFYGIKFHSTGGGLTFATPGFFRFDGCHLDFNSVGGLSAYNGAVVQFYPLGLSDLSTSFYTGTYAHTGDATSAIVASAGAQLALINGLVNSAGVYIDDAQLSCTCTVLASRVYGANGAELSLSSGFASTSAPAAGVQLDKAHARLDSCSIASAGGDAVRLDTGSQANLTGVTGSGSSGVGIRVQRGSRAIVDGTTTVTGTGGDLAGDSLTSTYSAMRASTGVRFGAGSTVLPGTSVSIASFFTGSVDIRDPLDATNISIATVSPYMGSIASIWNETNVAPDNHSFEWRAAGFQLRSAGHSGTDGLPGGTGGAFSDTYAHYTLSWLKTGGSRVNLLNIDEGGNLSVGGRLYLGDPSADMNGNADGTNAVIALNPFSQPHVGASLVNSVASGGTANQLDNWTSLTVYATDAAAIRNAIFQLGEKVRLIEAGLKQQGLSIV